MPRDVFEIEAGDARRRQLDGQRQAIDAATDVGDDTTRALGAERAAHSGPRALLEQAHRGARGYLVEAGVLTHHREGCESVGQLLLDPQRFSTRRQHPQAGQLRDERVDQVGDGGHHVLAVIEE